MNRSALQLLRRCATNEHHDRRENQTAQEHGAILQSHLAAILAFGFMIAMSASAEAQVSTPLSPVASPAPATPAVSGPPVNLSLVEAVALGLRDNRTIRSAYLDRIAQRFDLVVAKSAFLPKLNIVGDVEASRTLGPPGTTSSLSPTATWLAPTGATVQFSWVRYQTVGGGQLAQQSETTNLTVTQPLLQGAGLAVNLAPVRIAELQEQINKLALKTTVSATVTSIIQAYRSLQQAQEQLKLAKASQGRSKSLLETNRSLIAAGRMAAADLIQTEADAANQEVAVLQAEQTRESAQLALLQLLSVDLRTDVIAADPINAEHMDINLEQVIALGLNNRMDLLAERKTLAQDRQSLIVAKNNRLWNLSVVGSVENEHFSGAAAALATVAGTNTVATVTSGTTGSVGLQLNVPIGNFSLRQGEIQAQINVKKAEIQLEDLEQQVEASVRDAAHGVEISWRQLEAARQARALAAQALENERDKLKAGRASNFEVLAFEADLRAANTQSLASSIAYLNALTTLDQQLGTTLDTWRVSLND
jgi:outer membrane protein TolC